MGTLAVGEPIHTAVVSWGVEPTNQAFSWFWEVPVLPHTARPGSRARVPVPDSTTVLSTAMATRACWADTTRRPSSGPSNTTRPRRSTTFSTKRGAW